ncbi:MAG TPA: hypothetical protein VJL39_03430 [Candidatus Paceibacterota bacterium]
MIQKSIKILRYSVMCTAAFLASFVVNFSSPAHNSTDIPSMFAPIVHADAPTGDGGDDGDGGSDGCP